MWKCGVEQVVVSPSVPQQAQVFRIGFTPETGHAKTGGGQVRGAILVLLGRLGHDSDLCDVVKC